MENKKEALKDFSRVDETVSVPGSSVVHVPVEV